mmetsp:Transcript_51866/g.147835  ORF Transcript_51866/g.147835 Transcript_51866/m.147835 type:complete len:261 (-) Transcript_51866:215-997(-)
MECAVPPANRDDGSDGDGPLRGGTSTLEPREPGRIAPAHVLRRDPRIHDRAGDEEVDRLDEKRTNPREHTDEGNRKPPRCAPRAPLRICRAQAPSDEADPVQDGVKVVHVGIAAVEVGDGVVSDEVLSQPRRRNAMQHAQRVREAQVKPHRAEDAIVASRVKDVARSVPDRNAEDQSAFAARPQERLPEEEEDPERVPRERGPWRLVRTASKVVPRAALELVVFGCRLPDEQARVRHLRGAGRPHVVRSKRPPHLRPARQ